jgi:glycosyltransferase involved in cell wall biosynthesis
MKILMVAHQFLPRHLAGSEIYTYRLAKAMQARGHDVVLFFTEIRLDRDQYTLSRGIYDGIPYFEAVHNHRFDSFAHTYRDPDMERLFTQVLEATAPDVVHIQHLHLHSIGDIDIASARGVAIVYTLHEYILLCLNRGLMLRHDDTLCPGPDVEACAQCARATFTSWYPGTSAAGRIAWRIGDATRRAWGAIAPGGDRWREEVTARREAIAARLAKVDLFIAPSRFLRDRYVESGLIDPRRIVQSSYGFHVTAPLPRRSDAAVFRAGYIGTISAFKGVPLLFDAVREIDDPGFECRIYGDLDTFPEIKAQLLARGVPPSVRLMGRIEPDQVPAALAELDLLIVPSRWYENSPLTIHEAFLAGVPVLTANRGGMAELVTDEHNGLTFAIGDAEDLRRQLLRARHDRALLARLAANAPALKTIDEDAADLESRYRAIVASRRDTARSRTPGCTD